MAQWLVTQGDNQFPVDGIPELKKLAEAGKLRLGDLIQPPGASDWVYAAEVPGLAALLPEDEDDDDVSYSPGRGAAVATAGVMILGLLTVTLVSLGGVFYFAQQVTGGEQQLLGEGGLSFTCLLYTSPSPRDVEESRMPSSA